MATNENIFIHEVFGLTREQIKKNCIQGVQDFERVFGFVPFSTLNRERVLRGLVSAVKLSKKDVNFLKVLAALPRTETAKKYFGSWAHLLGKAEVLHMGISPQGGYQSIAKDGHLCLSVGERLICEALTARSIKHSKEPLYPFDTEMNSRRRMRADFRVGKTYIEFAGRMNNPSYKQRIELKKKLAKKYKIRLIVLESADDRSIEEAFDLL